jgi:hypothetical protein
LCEKRSIRSDLPTVPCGEMMTSAFAILMKHKTGPKLPTRSLNCHLAADWWPSTKKKKCEEVNYQIKTKIKGINKVYKHTRTNRLDFL